MSKDIKRAKLRRRFLTTAALWVIGGFAGALVFGVVFASLRGGPEELVTVLTGSFIGAFFAFFFLRLADLFNRLYDSRERDIDAHKRAQHYLNECVTQLSDNNTIAEKLIDTAASNAANADAVCCWTNRMVPIVIEKGLLFDLINVDYVNELFSFNVGIRKFNDTVDTVNRTYDHTQSSFFAGVIDRDSFVKNIGDLASQVGDVVKLSKAAQQEAAGLVGASRALLQSRPPLWDFLNRSSLREYGPGFEELRERAKSAVLAEMKASEKMSKGRIEKTLKEEAE